MAADEIAPSRENAAESQAQARSEVQEYLQISQQRRRLFPRAIRRNLRPRVIFSFTKGEKPSFLHAPRA